MTLNITEPTVGASSGTWGTQLNDALTAIVAYVNALESNAQPVDADLTAIAALTTTAYGRSLLTQANAAAAQTVLGLGSAATQATSAFDAAGAAATALSSALSGAATDATTKANAAAAASQPLDSDLTAIAALTTTTFGRSFLALVDAAAARTLLGLGTAATQASTAFAPAGSAGLPSTIVSKTTAYTAAAGDFVEADTSTAGFTVTLPTAPAAGTLVAVKKVSSDTNTLTIAAAASGTIDGQATATTVTQWAGVVLEHKGSNVWRVAASMSTTGPAGTNGTNGTNGAISAVQDEGSALTVRPTINFVGAGVTATDDAANSRTLVTISGAAAGASGLLPRALASGRYYTTPGATASLTMSAGYKYCFAFEVFASTSFTAIGLHIVTLQASSVIRLGAYDADPTTGLPRNLVFDGGSTIDGGSTGAKEIAITQTLSAGIYWLAARSTGANATPFAQQYLPVLTGSTTQAGIMSNPSSGYNDNGGGSGALDATWGATYQSATIVPKIVLKTA